MLSSAGAEVTFAVAERDAHLVARHRLRRLPGEQARQLGDERPRRGAQEALDAMRPEQADVQHLGAGEDGLDRAARCRRLLGGRWWRLRGRLFGRPGRRREDGRREGGLRPPAAASPTEGDDDERHDDDGAAASAGGQRRARRSALAVRAVWSPARGGAGGGSRQRAHGGREHRRDHRRALTIELDAERGVGESDRDDGVALGARPSPSRPLCPG